MNYQNKHYKHIEDLYEMDRDFQEQLFKSTLFDFYLDFIGYTTSRNLKEEEEEEEKSFRDYEKRYKARHSLSTHKWKYQVHDANQIFGCREYEQFGKALLIFENVGYEDVYKFIDNLLKEK
tara:strand:+ start:465 stop:827 length:363 start_codon:yes stop_codon:yes gene_type:complete